MTKPVLERRRSLSLTYELMRLRTITCLDSWVRRMAQTTGRQPGAAHRPLARGMKRPSSTALRQGRSFPEFTLSKRMAGSLRPSSGRRERMEHRRPKHKSEPRHPAPFEVPWARHPLRRPAGQTPAAEHRLHQADKQLVRVLPRAWSPSRAAAATISATTAIQWTITACAPPEGPARWTTAPNRSASTLGSEVKCQVPLADGKWPGPQAKEVWVRPKLSRLFWQVISGSRPPAPCMNPRRATRLAEQKLMRSVERDRVEP